MSIKVKEFTVRNFLISLFLLFFEKNNYNFIKIY